LGFKSGPIFGILGLFSPLLLDLSASHQGSQNPDVREGTFFLEEGGLGPQRGGSSVKVSTKRGGPYLM